ncbi:ComEA family DNA-binding protein [Sediminibacillus dalangtanensis]|uniref:ComEA family DNA-binding protein n=1 Tax=Sediminibacillus dalangtanensis TaxID=2729421 RepID=A0ABX7VWB1_9BACI|nr:helix-hairpin-helix domain-containing protein [Sediminibacillus dalangtanensis]QTM99890.1 ComEA family DNA-binding protein [Sediminibacillus dalangtanensis]
MEIVKKHIRIILIMIGVLVMSAIYLLSEPLTAEEGNTLSLPEEMLGSSGTEAEQNRDPLNQIEKGEVYVDIKGEVKHPGVYAISADKRVRDAIELAGGFLEEADSNAVNLAQKVQDEQVIMVPAQGEQGENSAGEAVQGNSKIRVNTADAEELTKLPGIGPSKADAIIQYRDENGGYQQLEELLEVAGIGEKTLEKIASSIQVP